MPTYDYLCKACGARMEIFHSIKEGPRRKCPECGALKLERQIGTGAGILFKGSGFYQTDYRSDSYKKGEAEAKKASEDKGADKASDSNESPGSKKTDGEKSDTGKGTKGTKDPKSSKKKAG